MFITHPLLLLRPNLSRPEQERVVQICSHILSVSANKLFHVFNENMQVLGKVDAGFTQWRGTMLSVSLTIGFMILLNLDLFQPGACLVFAGHLKGRREVGLPPSGDLQEAALPVHAQPCHCQEVPLPGESRKEGKL